MPEPTRRGFAMLGLGGWLPGFGPYWSGSTCWTVGLAAYWREPVDGTGPWAA